MYHYYNMVDCVLPLDKITDLDVFENNIFGNYAFGINSVVN